MGMGAAGVPTPSMRLQAGSSLATAIVAFSLSDRLLAS